MVAAVLAARGAIAGVFGIAAYRKSRDLRAFQSVLIAAGLRASFASSLILIEAFTAFGLVMERRTAWSAYVATGLMLGFVAFVGRQVMIGDQRPCPCFGVARVAPVAKPSNMRTLARNVALLAIAIIATGSTSSPSQTQHATWLRQLCVVGVALAVAIAVGVRTATTSTPEL